MKTDNGRIDELALDDAPDALDRLLAEARVAVDPAFTRQVMSRLPEATWSPRPDNARLGDALPTRSARNEWAIAAAVATFLIIAAGFLVTGGEAAEPGVGTSIVHLLVSTLAAGAGFLAASWRGLGVVVNAALDGSWSALLALGLAALFANGLLVLLLRRRRGAAVKSGNDT